MSDKKCCRTNYITFELCWEAATKVPVWERTPRGAPVSGHSQNTELLSRNAYSLLENACPLVKV